MMRKLTREEDSGRLALLIYADRGLGRRRMLGVFSGSILLHASVVVILGFVRLARIAPDAENVAGDPREVEIEEVEINPMVEAPVEVVEMVEVPEPSSTPDFAEAMPTPTPKPVVAPRVERKPAPRMRVAAPAGRGTPLVLAGNDPTGWSTPKPDYPYQARRLRRQGSGGVRVTTNGIGRVVNAEMMPGIDPLLDAVAVNFARSAWTGPPNATRIVAITFLLE